MRGEEKKENINQLRADLPDLWQNEFGALNLNFLEMEVGGLAPAEPHCVMGSESVASAIAKLRDMKVGCLLVVDQMGILTGIFSERDCILKVFGEIPDYSQVPVQNYMTPDPVTGSEEITVAFALNLMSQGGFRHLPLVDVSGRPVGILSVKNIIDAITARFLSACSEI